jgi:hypothetical protein
MTINITITPQNVPAGANSWGFAFAPTPDVKALAYVGGTGAGPAAFNPMSIRISEDTYWISCFTWPDGETWNESVEKAGWWGQYKFEDRGSYIADFSTKTLSALPAEKEYRASPCPPLGDIDDDGYITEVDYQLVESALRGVRPISEVAERGDVDGDGIITENDVSLIKQYVDGAIDTFPICKKLAIRKGLIILGIVGITGLVILGAKAKK